MIRIIKNIIDSIDGLIWNLGVFGVIFLILGILILMDGSLFVLRLVMGAIIMVVSYTFIYTAIKIHVIKTQIKEQLNIKENFKSLINKKI